MISLPNFRVRPTIVIPPPCCCLLVPMPDLPVPSFPLSHASYSCSSSIRTGAPAYSSGSGRIVRHSATYIRPISLGVKRSTVTCPGTRSCFTRISGIQNEWITSIAVISMRTCRSTGNTSSATYGAVRVLKCPRPLETSHFNSNFIGGCLCDSRSGHRYRYRRIQRPGSTERQSTRSPGRNCLRNADLLLRRLLACGRRQCCRA